MATIFWDFDGTLVYSHHLWSGSMYRALTSIDPHTTVSFLQIRECNTRGFTWQTPDRDHRAWKGEMWWLHFEAHAYSSYLSCGVEESIAAAAAALVRRFILDVREYHLYPDALDVLNQTSAMGHRNVILSNNYPELADTMQQLGLLPYFDGLIVSAVEGYDKPRRELFDLAKKRYPDHKYYMIGDNPKADIVGGNNAGITTVLVHNKPYANADYSFTNLHNVLTILST